MEPPQRLMAKPFWIALMLLLPLVGTVRAELFCPMEKLIEIASCPHATTYLSDSGSESFPDMSKLSFDEIKI